MADRGTVHVPYSEYRALLERLEQAEQERDAARAHVAVLTEWFEWLKDRAENRPAVMDCYGGGTRTVVDALETVVVCDKALSVTPTTAYAEWQVMQLVCEEALKAKQKQPDCAMPPDFWYVLNRYENHQWKGGQRSE